MRSRSTLLSHVLGSHDEILGYSELHQSYRSPLDFLQMGVRVCLSTRRLPCARYLLDKILHNSHVLTERMLKHNKLRLVFLLREPESTLKSLIRMGTMTGVSYYTVPCNASDYYCQRLARLGDYAIFAKDNAIYIESDDLLDRTDAVLRDMSAWLGLSTPLMRAYRLFRRTGRFKSGDPLSNIQIGSIVRTGPYNDVSLPSDVLKAARSSYYNCQRALQSLRL